MGNTSVSVGDRAPEFKAAGTGDRTYALSDYAGSPVVLVFYPGDATPACTEQLRSYSANFDQFNDLGVHVLALSPQDVESHEAFSAANSFRFPLLYDEGKAIGDAYGIRGPLGFYRRSVFVIDGDGIIRYARRSTAGMTYVRSDELLQAIAATQAAS